METAVWTPLDAASWPDWWFVADGPIILAMLSEVGKCHWMCFMRARAC